MFFIKKKKIKCYIFFKMYEYIISNKDIDYVLILYIYIINSFKNIENE